MPQHYSVPKQGEKIRVLGNGVLEVPDEPIIPYIEGDGTGFDITPVMIKVVDAADAKDHLIQVRPFRHQVRTAGRAEPAQLAGRGFE